MSQISLTASMRSNLLSLQGTSQLMSQTQERLANGKKVNSAIDNASAYYTAQSLSNRASDLSGLLDSMGQAISTIKAANEGIESITAFVEQAKAVATSAVDTNDAKSRKSYGEQFNSIMEQLDKLASDSGYKGINLLQGNDLTVIFNESRDNKLEIKGVNATASELGLTEQDWDVENKDAVKTAAADVVAKEKALTTAQAAKIDVSAAKKVVNGDKVIAGTAAADTAEGKIITDGTKYWKVTTAIDAHASETDVAISTNATALQQGEDGNWYLDKTAADTAYDNLESSKEAYDEAVTAAKAEITTAINGVIEKATTAIETLRSYASDFGTNYSIVQNRQSFTENLINVLEEGADNLTLADMNEESANMLALQTRQQLAINSLSLASQASQSVMRLFS